MMRLTQLGVDVAGISIDREERGVALPDEDAELAECERLAKTLTVEQLAATHQRIRPGLGI